VPEIEVVRAYASSDGIEELCTILERLLHIGAAIPLFDAG